MCIFCSLFSPQTRKTVFSLAAIMPLTVSLTLPLLEPSNTGLEENMSVGVQDTSPILGASKDKRDDLVKERAKNKNKRLNLESNLEGVDASLGKLAVELEATKESLPVLQTQYQEAQARLATAKREHQVVSDRLLVAQEQSTKIASDLQAGQEAIEKSKVAIGQLACEVYRGGALESPLYDLLFESETPQEFSLRANAARNASWAQSQILENSSRLTAENRNLQHRQLALTEHVSLLKKQAAELVQSTDKATKSAAAKAQEMQALKTKQEALNASLEAQKSLIEKQVKEAEAEDKAIAKRIAAIDAANRAANGGNGLKARTLGSGAIFGNPVASGYHITSLFGYRTHPILHYRLFHQGTDIGAPCGTPQYASQSGVVVSVGWDGTGGNTIYINHGVINGQRWMTGYRHFKSFAVRAGQSVKKGQVIGYTGSTGRSTGCHVHFEIWRNGVAIDPLPHIHY